MKGCYNAGHGIDKVIPVNMYIPGCPPRPEAILFGILKLVGGTDHPTEKEVVAAQEIPELEEAETVGQ